MVIILLFVSATLLSSISGLPDGAPADPSVCIDLTPQHVGNTAQPCLPASCEFSLIVDSIDSGQVLAGQENFYRCGAVHRSKLFYSPAILLLDLIGIVNTSTACTWSI